ncbi:MAG: mechanosensitive ion channel [Cyanobacteria bacterium SBLK]|nr:mechanosensitive ion channel [Cyanobacteria bacterium SBLK]
MAQKSPNPLSRLTSKLAIPRSFLFNAGQLAADYLLFPSLCWLALWLFSLLFSQSATLIASFILPLVSVFWGYSLLALATHLFFGQEIYQLLMKRFCLPLVIIYAIVRGLGLFVDLSLLSSTELFEIAGTTITLRSFFIGSVGLYLWFTGVQGMSQLARQILLRQMQVDEGALDASLILARYFLIGFGLFIAFSELNLDATAIAAISGGLAVGVGFGLQDVVVNFVSGIMLLFERSLHPGDIISIDDKLGRVEDINIRATTIRTVDNVELVIPNQLFLTDTLTSYTRNNRLARFNLEIPIAWDHDPESVIATLLDVVHQDGRIVTSLTSEVEIAELGEENIGYKLQIWTDEPLAIDAIKSDLYRSILATLTDRGITPDLSEDVAIDVSVKDIALQAFPEAISPTPPPEAIASPKQTTPAKRLGGRINNFYRRFRKTDPPEPTRNLPLEPLPDNSVMVVKEMPSLAKSTEPPPVSTPKPSPPKSNKTPLRHPSGTPQIELIETSFEKIKPRAGEFAASFYENLFKLYPRTRSFFNRTDMKKQQDKLLASLVLLVQNVRDPVALKPVLQDLGAKHKGYGVGAKHYPAVGDALLQTFEQYLQEEWTAEVKQAWVDTFQAITQIMLEGADGLR